MEPNNNNTGWWIGGSIVVLLLIIGGIFLFRSSDDAYTGLEDEETPSGTVSSMILPYGGVTIGLGESASFRGITITPTSVAEDSRCPQSVQCIQAGTVRLNVRAQLDNGVTSNTTVTLGSAAAISTYSVTLSAVAPNRVQTGTIAGTDYRFTFQVRQSDSVPTTGDEVLEAKG